MKDMLKFKVWLESEDKEFYDQLVEEGLIPSWLRNVFIAGTIAMGSHLITPSEVRGAEFTSQSTIDIKKEKIEINVKLPIKITRLDLASENIKASIKKELLKFLQNQERERLESKEKYIINLKTSVFVDVEERDINPLLSKFDLREILPSWKFGDQDKLARLLNVFIKSTESEKKLGFQNVKFTIYYEKIKMPDSTNANSKNNPTKSNILK